MITQRLQIDGKDIVKSDGSLFSAWGHNGIGHSNIEETEYPLHADGKCFSINKIEWTWTGSGTNYTIQLYVNEPLANLTFQINSEKLAVSNINLTANDVISPYTARQIGSVQGPALNPFLGEKTITAVNPTLNTISFVTNLNYFVQNGNQSIANAVIGKISTEYVFAVLKANNSKIIRFNIQMYRFLKDENTFFTAATNTVQPGHDPLKQLHRLFNLAAKYDVYIIICGSNAFEVNLQPNWLKWATEKERWTAQKTIFREVSKRLGNHPALAWYSLINEPLQNDVGVVETTSGIMDSVTGTVVFRRLWKQTPTLWISLQFNRVNAVFEHAQVELGAFARDN